MAETFRSARLVQRASFCSVALLIALCSWVSLGCGRDRVMTLPEEYQGALFSKTTKRVYLVREGSSETDKHVGWVIYNVKENSSGEEEIITYAVDGDLNDIGFYLNDSGATYTYDANGQPTKRGNLEWPRALEVFYGLGEIYRVVDKI